jgi:hypothetical protein
MAAAPFEPTGTSIEALFRPTTRFRDRLGWTPEGFTELELLPGLTVENVVAAGITWEGLCRFARDDKIVWMTPDGFVFSLSITSSLYPLTLDIGVDYGTSMFVRATTAGAAATCDFFLRLLATSGSDHLFIRQQHIMEARPPSISGAGLSIFFQESRSCLRKFELKDMTLSEDQCRALASMSRLDVQLDMFGCRLVDDAAGTFVECLHSDGGPVKLLECRIDSQILACALAGDSRVTSFKHQYYFVTSDADMALLFTALASNKNLVDLDLWGCPISNENWSVLCESIRAHPTLTSVDFRNTSPRSPNDAPIRFSDEQKLHRARAIADMMKNNTVLHTITQDDANERDQQIYDETVQPYLETNRYRPRVHAIKKADISLRRPLFGLALQTRSVRNSSNLLWMFLSGNADVVLQSNEEGEQIVEVAESVPVEVAASAPLEVAVARKRKH